MATTVKYLKSFQRGCRQPRSPGSAAICRGHRKRAAICRGHWERAAICRGHRARAAICCRSLSASLLNPSCRSLRCSASLCSRTAFMWRSDSSRCRLRLSCIRDTISSCDLAFIRFKLSWACRRLSARFASISVFIVRRRCSAKLKIYIIYIQNTNCWCHRNFRIS